MSETHRMIVLAKAVDGRVEELEQWYRDQHIPDLLAVPGIIGAELAPARVLKQPDASPGYDFVVVYTIEGDDPMSSIIEAGRRLGTDLMPKSELLDSSATISLLAPQGS